MRNKGIKIDKVNLCGGGKRTEVWPKIVADVLNVEVDLIKNEEGPALGAAILAMVANKEFKNVIDASDKIVVLEKVLKPNKDLVKRYDVLYKKYKKIYSGLKMIDL